VNDKDKKNIVDIAKRLSKMNFKLFATKGTYDVLKKDGIKVEMVHKISDGSDDIVNLIKNGELKLIINTPSADEWSQSDVKFMRSLAVKYGIPCITTIQGAYAAVNGMEAVSKEKNLKVKSIQFYHKGV